MVQRTNGIRVPHKQNEIASVTLSSVVDCKKEEYIFNCRKENSITGTAAAVMQTNKNAPSRHATFFAPQNNAQIQN